MLSNECLCPNTYSTNVLHQLNLSYWKIKSVKGKVWRTDRQTDDGEVIPKCHLCLQQVTQKECCRLGFGQFMPYFSPIFWVLMPKAQICWWHFSLAKLLFLRPCTPPRFLNHDWHSYGCGGWTEWAIFPHPKLNCNLLKNLNTQFSAYI